MENDFELRVFVVGGEPIELVYTNFGRKDPDGYCRDFIKIPRHKAIQAPTPTPTLPHGPPPTHAPCRPTPRSPPTLHPPS